METDYKIEHIEEDGLVCEVKTYPSGSKAWYYNDRLHRLNGPAVEYTNGTKHWYYKGKFHRLNGPAVEFANGDNVYYINGKSYETFEEYKEAVIQIKIKEILNEN